MASYPFQLVLQTGPNPGSVYELQKEELYIGRDVNNDVVINDAEVSRKHARLVLRSGGYVLEDLGSTNGTFVSGERLMGPHMLRPGETIMLGENVSLIFESGFDADATMIAGTAQPPTYVPPPPVAAKPETYSPSAKLGTAPLRQTYTGQVPAGPAEPYLEQVVEEPKRDNRTLIYIGCGILVVLLCIVATSAFIFDYLNLYCTPPFDGLFYCP
ncbi:MAG TPA: FHA domain-containing protein [Anaerolineales bacterium]|nr:FHA domain-containing protein [Anaerolineales bacterium]